MKRSQPTTIEDSDRAAMRKTVARLRASIDPEKLAHARLQLRRRGRRRMAKSFAGPLMILGGLVLGGAAAARRGR